ncbi:lantibiotic dehydratase [Streptomyces sp. WAC01526]|uniref:lantibiotic dehydratase n=1 Tax=Streptomyces sp. WAC01526 TaxID=2588709 RepID=UPI001651C700|nr:lantibiotic dehydratase [Streptomyces sp. WAC01526]
MNTPPDPLVRVAGVPRSALAVLRTPKSFAAAEQLLDAQEQIAEEGRSLADALHPVIGALPDPRLKPRVVGLRRAVHRGRAPRPAEWDSAVRSALPGPLADRIRRWLDGRDLYEAQREELAAVLAAETREVHSALRDTVASARFRQGLLHASRELDDVLERWLAAPGSGPPAGKALVSLARYLARAAVKTSPQGAFTATGRGRWTDQGPWLRMGDLEQRTTHTELNLARLRRIAHAVLRAEPGLRDGLRLRPNPALDTASDALRVLTPGPPSQVICLPAPARLAQLRDAIGQVDGMTAGSAGPAVRRFVAAGILLEDVPLDDLDSCPLKAFTEWLTRHTRAMPAGTLDALTGLRTALLRHPRAADHTERRDLDGAVRARLHTVERSLGLPPPREAFERRPFHEDAVLTGPAAELARGPWAPLLSDLAATGRALAVLDRDLPARYMAAAWFAERYGRGARVPLLTFLHGLQDEQSLTAGHVCSLLRPGSGADDGLLRERPSPVLHALADRRAEVLETLLRGELPPDLTSPRPPLSLAYYVQPLPGPGGLPRAVLNSVTVGHGHWRGRLDRIQALAHGRAVPPGPGHGRAGGPLPVDIGGLYASNTNLRRPTLPHAFDHPFVRSTRPAPERIPLGAVTVHLDRATGLPALHAPRFGADLVPVHLGLMSPLLLPPPLAVVLRLFGDPHTLFRTGHPLLPGPFTDDVPDRGFRQLSRIEVGRVVLRRTTWLGRAAALPRRAPGERDHEHLLRLLAWRRELGLPERCFVRTRRPGGPTPDAFADKGYKPAYLDFASPLLVTAFARSLGGPDTVVHIEEALPDPGVPGTAPYTSEFVVELPGDPHEPRA